MWIETQEGDLLNLDRLFSISVIERNERNKSRSHVIGNWRRNDEVTLGSFDTLDEAFDYFKQLEKLLTKESDHD